MASSVCCVVYASHEKLRVQSSLASWMLRGPVAWRLRTVLVPASRSQVLTRLISARILSMADCRVTCSRLLRSPAVAKGPAFWRARISVRRGGRPGGLGQVGQKRRSNPVQVG